MGGGSVHPERVSACGFGVDWIEVHKNDLKMARAIASSVSFIGWFNSMLSSKAVIGKQERLGCEYNARAIAACSDTA